MILPDFYRWRLLFVRVTCRWTSLALELRAVGGEMTKTTTGFAFLPPGQTLLSGPKGMTVVYASFIRRGNAGFVD